MADPLSVAASIIAVLQLTGTVLKYLRDVNHESTDRKRLILEISSTRGMLSTLKDTVDDTRSSGETWSATIQALGDPEGPLAGLKTTLQQLATILEGPASATGIKKAAKSLRWPFEQKEVERLLTLIDRQKITLSLALENDHIALSREIYGNTKEIQDNTRAIQDDVACLSIDLAAARLDAKADAEFLQQNVILAQLPCAEGASFNARSRDHQRRCLPDTRVGLINDITAWSNTLDGSCIFWLNGMAGTGKSTISRTIAHNFADQNRLGASFFFSRGQGDLGHAGKLFTTIASQLAHAMPDVRGYICNAIAEEYQIGTQGLSEQWRKLIVQPLSKSDCERQLPVVIVIDALDECDSDDKTNDIEIILKLLAGAKDIQNIQMRIFLTSRPEVSIHHGFRTMTKMSHQDYILHHTIKEIVEHDILVFFNYEFERIREKRDLEVGWPRKDEVELLVQDAKGLFIYAATICRFIDRRNPQKQLSLILQFVRSSTSNIGASASRTLDEVYTQVLKSAIYQDYDDEERGEVVDLFKQIVGSIIILSDTLSTAALASLLDLPRMDLHEILQQVQAVLDVPATSDLPIRLLHPSFRDFLLDHERCREDQLWIEEKKAHEKLSESCIKLMSNTLKKDICNLRIPGTLASEVSHITIDRNVPSALQYACCYWVHHLQHSCKEIYDNGPTHQYLQAHFLHWLEALSLMKILSSGIHMITALQSMIKPDVSPRLYALAYDAKRFILNNRFIIEIAPLQTYASALVFSPTKSIIRHFSLELVPKWIIQLPKVEKDWSPSLQTLEGHSNSILSVVFSPDGRQLASGSYDRTLRLWDVVTGKLQQTLNGHNDWVFTVAFSPDGQRLASGSADKSVRIWDVATGTLQLVLKGHRGAVLSVSFSPDGLRLASGSRDKTVRIWDVFTGTLQQALTGHNDWILTAVFSPNGQQLAVGSRDRIVRLWGATTGALQQTLEGHNDSVLSIAFSPDGRQLASSSRDKTVRIWNATTGVIQQTLNSHSDWVSSVVFSPDGQLLASGSSDKTVRLWAVSGGLQQTFEGHSDSVFSVAFSPDGQQLVSASRDKTMRLWDASGLLQQTHDGHTDWVFTVEFSPDGQQLASGSSDSTIRLWDAVTGTLNNTLTGHTGSIFSVAFSSDMRQIATGSRDKTVRIWDASGVLKHTLDGHSDSVWTVAFSPNGHQLASGSRDKTVRLWDVATGALQQSIEVDFFRKLSFVSDTILQTEIGQIDLGSSTLNRAPEPPEPQETLFSISSDESWITWKGQNILWLPIDYRPICKAFRDNAVGLGCLSKRVLIIRFESDPSQKF